MIYEVESKGPAGAIKRGGMDGAAAGELFEEMLPQIHKLGGEIYLWAIYHNGDRTLVSSFERPRQTCNYADLVSHEALGYTP